MEPLLQNSMKTEEQVVAGSETKELVPLTQRLSLFEDGVAEREKGDYVRAAYYFEKILNVEGGELLSKWGTASVEAIKNAPYISSAIRPTLVSIGMEEEGAISVEEKNAIARDALSICEYAKKVVGDTTNDLFYRPRDIATSRFRPKDLVSILGNEIILVINNDILPLIAGCTPDEIRAHRLVWEACRTALAWNGDYASYFEAQGVTTSYRLSTRDTEILEREKTEAQNRLLQIDENYSEWLDSKTPTEKKKYGFKIGVSILLCLVFWPIGVPMLIYFLYQRHKENKEG